MAKAAVWRILIGLATAGSLMGCVEGGSSGSADGSGTTAAPAKAKTRGGNVDVEAPEVFQTTDSALWDGRPSLGGIWVAAPEVTNPERALMFNPATGKSVTGALFRRERENPGPRLQLSSDAAEALGILAGQPTEITVTALRKQETEKPAPDPAPAEETAAVAAAGDEAGSTDAKPGQEAEAAAIATAALDAVDADAGEAAAAEPSADAAADPAAAAAAGAAAGAAVAADAATPERKTWKERRAEAKAAREAKRKAAAEAKAAAAGTAADGAATEVPAESAGVAAIETAPLDARTPEVSEAAESAAGADPAKVETPKATVKAAPAVVEAKPEEKAATAETTAAEGTTSGATGSRPIQVASFSKEDNARRAAEALAKIDITATPQKAERDGNAVWGVVVMGDDAMLKKIKDAGFADAYFLK